MATVKFVLKEPNSDKESLIYALVRFDNNRVKYSIGHSIHPNFWDKDNQEAIIKSSHEQLIELKLKLSNTAKESNKTINVQIGRYQEAVIKIFDSFTIQRVQPTIDAVRTGLDEEFKYLPNIKKITLHDYIDKFIKDIESGNRLNGKGEKYQHSSVKNYYQLRAQLDKFQKEKHRVLDFKDITTDTYDDLLKFFREKDYSTNSIGRVIKTLKSVLNASFEEGLHTNTQYQLRKFKAISEKIKPIYLSLSELERIYNLDLSDSPELATARDIFLVGCFTALRYSDYSRIKPQHIQTTSSGIKVIRIITKKTGEEVIIPMWHWILEEIIDKYPDGLPKSYEQKINKRIKDIGEEAKINEPVNKVVYKQGTKYEVTTPKYKLIMTHTARRSGATNMYKEGIPTVDIMKITGHSLESNFFKYIQLTKEETAERITRDYKINKPLHLAK